MRDELLALLRWYNTLYTHVVVLDHSDTQELQMPLHRGHTLYRPVQALKYAKLTMLHAVTTKEHDCLLVVACCWQVAGCK